MIPKGMTAPSLPFRPLQRWVGLSEDVALAAYLGTSRGSIRRWRKQGIPTWRADELAVMVGAHPGELWSEWWDVA